MRIVLDEWRKMRKLRKEIASLEAEEAALRSGRDSGEPPDAPATAEEYGRNATILNLNHLSVQLAELETKRLVRKARRLGIHIPRDAGWWWEAETVARVTPHGTYEGTYYLTDAGKSGISKLIREERKKSVGWWVTNVIVPLLTAIISVLGLIVALVSVSKK